MNSRQPDPVHNAELRALARLPFLTMSACSECGTALLYCDRHDAFLCPVCDAWVEGTCAEADCPYCPGRPDKPSACSHPDEPHVRID